MRKEKTKVESKEIETRGYGVFECSHNHSLVFRERIYLVSQKIVLNPKHGGDHVGYHHHHFRFIPRKFCQPIRIES